MPYTLAADIHTHTLYSRHAYSTIMENAAAAQAVGLEVLGSADHFSCMTSVEPSVRNYQFFVNQEVWPRMWGNTLLLRGAEADIVSLEGELFGQSIPAPENITGQPYACERSLFERCTETLDYLVASVHRKDFAEGASVAQATDMYVAALDDPKVFVLGHIGRSGVEFDLDTVLTEAARRHKLVEINEHSVHGGPGRTVYKECRRIAERCAELGVGITTSTDAHIATDIGRFEQTEGLLEEIHFPEELVMNRSRAVLLDEMAAAGVCDLREFV